MSHIRWVDLCKQKNAFWVHDGNPKRPHALLTSGKHSDGFFNSELVMEDPLTLDEACRELMVRLNSSRIPFLAFHRVVGPAMGAITFAHDMARHIAEKRGYSCFRSYVEKEERGGIKSMLFRRTSLHRGEIVFLVEDVLTTGESVRLMKDAVIGAGGLVFPRMAVLVNRSGLSKIAGMEIIALIDQPLHNWNPEECPLCKEGSEAIRPKTGENWVRLNADYCN